MKKYQDYSFIYWIFVNKYVKHYTKGGKGVFLQVDK